MIVSSWSSFAVVQPDRMAVVLPTGEVEQRDKAYQFLEGESKNPKILLQAMEQLGRFYR